MPGRSRRGDSLIELLVALVILELAGAGALALALTVEHLGRHAAHGAATDIQRWQAYRTSETDSTCLVAPRPDTATMIFPADPDRPELEVTWRCGH